MIKDEKSYQYKCYNKLFPIDVIEIKYEDYKKYFDEKKFLMITKEKAYIGSNK